VTGYQTGTKLWTGGGVAAAVEDYDASCDTEFGPQIGAQAWSAGTQPPQAANYHERHTWTTVLRAAGIGIGLAVALAGLLLALVGPSHSAPDDHNSWPPGYTQTPVSMPPTKEALPAPDPVWPPPDVPNAAVKTADGDYLTQLRESGKIIVDPAQAIRFAHATCRILAAGYSPMAIALTAETYHPEQGGLAGYVEQVHIAARVYCPEMDR
jgi:hypothetical protein